MSQHQEWRSPDEFPKLGARDVHVWRASLQVDDTTLARLGSTLSEDERKRAGRFFLELDRKAFITARGILRDLLGKYLACAPQSIEFIYGTFGKPAIGGREAQHDVQFNISHAHSLALFAFTIGGKVGVDLELIRPRAANEAVAARYFSTKEVQELAALPEEQRSEGFFLCWTRKEAYVKLLGEGLQALNASSGSPFGALRVELAGKDGFSYVIQSINLSDFLTNRYVAALAVQMKSHEPDFFEWVP